VYFSCYGEWTKKSGFASPDSGQTIPTRLLWDDSDFAGLLKARDADVFVHTRQTWKDAPDCFATDASFERPDR
jgi:hypothetical protein